MVPEIYYSGSRDFSFLARLFEVALNYMKTGADIIDYNLDSENADSTLIDLLCNTLGFVVKHKYINKDLVAVASTFSNLVKWKGSEYSIREAIKTLLNSQGIREQFELDSSDRYNKEITLILPPETKDIILLEDLFDYILPAGMLVTINYSKIYNYEDSSLSLSGNDVEFIRSFTDFAEVYNMESNPVEVCLSVYLNGDLVKDGYFENVLNLNINETNTEMSFDFKNKEGETLHYRFKFNETNKLWEPDTTITTIKFDNYIISEGERSIQRDNYSIYRGNLQV